MRILWLVIFMAVLAAPVCADPARTVQETVVRSAPETQAKQVAVLPAGTAVELKARQGGWYQVNVKKGQSGWLPLMAVRIEGGVPKHEKASGLGSLLGTYRTGSSGVTVATGVRGLDAVDLKNSQPNMEELQKIDKYSCSDAEARSYADKAGLHSRDIAWIQTADKEK